MRINREDFLKELEAVLPGLATREIIEQSSCFVFQDNQVITFNDEIACSHATSLEIEGAVVAMTLVSILRKLAEDQIDISVSEDNEKLLIKGKHKKIEIRMEAEILLQTESIEKPKKWKDLPEEFADAVSLVQQCASRDDSQFNLTCIHISPEHIEACDNYQAARYKIQTDVKKSVLIRKESLKHIVSLDMTEFSETKSWIHFRNPNGLIFSCRRYVEDYEDISSVLDMKGTKTNLPKGLKEATERAEVFSVDNAEDDQVQITLKQDKLKIKAVGANGKYIENKKIKHSGKPLTFTIAPKLLAELVQRHNNCKIGEDRLKVKVGKFSYVTVLGTVEK